MRFLFDRMWEGRTTNNRWQLALAAYNQGRGVVNYALDLYAQDIGTTHSALRGRVSANVIVNQYVPRVPRSRFDYVDAPQVINYVNKIYGFGSTAGGYTRDYTLQFR